MYVLSHVPILSYWVQMNRLTDIWGISEHAVGTGRGFCPRLVLAKSLQKPHIMWGISRVPAVVEWLIGGGVARVRPLLVPTETPPERSDYLAFLPHQFRVSGTSLSDTTLYWKCRHPRITQVLISSTISYRDVTID